MKLRSVGLFSICLIVITATLALASGNWSNTGSMNVARYEHTATILANGRVLVTGGANDTAILSSAELYKPSTGKWTFTGNMTVPRYGHDAVLLQDGQVLVAGAFPPACCGAPGLASAELYNPATGTWTATGNMTAGRVDFTLRLLSNGKVLAAGGDNVANTSAELYDPATGTWTATGSMTTGNNNPGAVLLQDGQVFVTANLNLYNPSTGTWSTITNAPSPRGAYPRALLPNGNVWLGGNATGDSLYNPSTNQWTTFAPPPCTITYPTSQSQSCQAAGALLNTGKVLIAGGATFVPAQPYPTEETNGLADLFDPSTLTWTTTGSMHTSRLAESMTVLSNGQVLVAGGETFERHVGHLVPIASAELCTP